MRFSCDQQQLSKALSTVSKASSSRTTIPILKNILLEAKSDGTLTLSASNLDLSIIKNIDVLVEEEGFITVNAKLFEDIIRKLPSGNVSVSLEENNTVFIKTLNSEFKIIGKEADDFPNISEIEGESETLSFNREIFCDMIGKTAFCASQDETKGIIVGVLLEIEENQFSMVSLDGFRMAIAREEMRSAQNKNIVIEAKNINEINKIIQDAEEPDITVILGEKRAIILLERTKIVTRLLEGEFIKYKDIIPSEKSISTVVGREELKEALERASLFANEGRNNLVRFNIQNNLLTITSTSEEGNVKEDLIVETEGEEIEIGFNSKYIIDALKAIEDEKVVLEMNTSITPCLIKPVNGNSFEYLILPVRIPSH